MHCGGAPALGEIFFDPKREKRENRAVRIHDAIDTEYPLHLKEMYDPPIGLYWLGDYKIDRPCVAIVGTRQASMYGLRVARKLGADLAALGFCVVSGMARGIDSAAHLGALDNGGPTLAVLGSGLDIIYPPENKELYQRIQKQGAELSEFPFGRRADRHTFPMRNRLVAGLCDAVIVVETGLVGGSMITARFAAEQGRSLMAVPGRIDQAQASGCLELIRDGATMVCSVDDVLEELRYERREIDANEEGIKEPLHPVNLEDREKALMHLFSGGNLETADSLASQVGIPVHEVTAILVALELKRCLVRRPDGRYEAREL